MTDRRPVRVQLSRRKGWRIPPNTLKVDRSTKWGNVYRSGMFKGFTAADAVDAFRARLKEGMHHDAQNINRSIHELRGKNLACWCKPGAPCHADVLLEIANA